MKKNVIRAIYIMLALVFALNGCDPTGGDNGNGKGNSNENNDNGGNNGNGNDSGNTGNGNGNGNNDDSNGNENNDNNNDNNNGSGQGFLTLARADIENATNLFIAPVSGAGENDKLYKITGNGAVEEVRYYDEENREMPMEREPSAVYNVNDEYAILVFGYDEGYLARKSDGTVFSLENIGLPDGWGHFFNSNIVQLDSNGNIYYHVRQNNAHGSIVKINIQNPSTLTKVTYSPSTDDVRVFEISPDGHLIYEYGGSGAVRVKKSNGGLYNLPNQNGLYFRMWIGIDGKIKYNSQTYPQTLVTINIDQNYNVTETSIPSISFHSGGYMLRFPGRTLFTDRVSPSNSLVYEMENLTNTPRLINFNSIISAIEIADQSDSYYYLFGYDDSGTPLLIKVNPVNDQVTTIISSGLYDIYKMNVSADDIVTFNALRMSDGAKVIGEISASGRVAVLDETINAEVTVLERIR